ncbi:MAG: anthranilate phosphoribosyltransferase [Thermoflexales bacterium]
MIQTLIAKLFDHKSLTLEEAYEAMDAIFSGNATPAQIGAYLAALRMKGETADEIAGSAKAMRSKALHVPVQSDRIVDVVGTGGDRSGTFNISTTAAFVVAGAGAPVAKHGNRAASSQSGSADVLAALGVKVDLHPEQVGRCIDEIGIGFMFAQTHHPAMKHAAGPRRELGARTIFNILGPLTNPAGAKRQLLGVYSGALTGLIAETLRELDSIHVLVVNGAGAVDELVLDGVNKVSELRNGDISHYEFSALEYGLAHAGVDALGGGTPEFNAAITRSVLEDAATPARRDVVLLNAGAALYAADVAADIGSGIALARESIRSGQALAKLEALIALSHHA